MIRNVLVAAVLAAAAAGCAGGDDVAALDPPVSCRVSEAMVGMMPGQVRATVGCAPEDVSFMKSADHVSMRWRFPDGSVSFEDGVVDFVHWDR
jgi:hypothetical protein